MTIKVAQKELYSHTNEALSDSCYKDTFHDNCNVVQETLEDLFKTWNFLRSMAEEK